MSKQDPQAMMVEAGHINTLFHDAANVLLKFGNEVDIKGNTTLELHPFILKLTDARKRTLFYPHRGNNPFATLFETMWILNGNNDIKNLKFFLPRAGDFSDNGTDWRAGYGRRIFNHAGIDSDRASGMVHDTAKSENWQTIPYKPIDQFRYVYDTLKSDPSSRQAVISIWDPAKECAVEKSKDFPCSNHLAYVIRDGKLDCTLTMRSNDILWGFSSINVYEFTFMQEILANMLCVEVGDYYHIANSFHCYKTGFNAEKNFAKLQKCANLPVAEIEEYNSLATEPIPATNDYECTILYYRKIYQDISRFINAGPHLFEKMVEEFYEEDNGEAPLYTFLHLYVLYQRKEALGIMVHDFQKIYRHHMSKLPMTDLKLSCHFWMLKQQKMIKPNELNRAYNMCQQLKEKK